VVADGLVAGDPLAVGADVGEAGVAEATCCEGVAVGGVVAVAGGLVAAAI